ncbi:MAG: 3-dehydroquinate synthase [Armatimonadetes bacterium]|nr:3-dehydroquinate synthase [Armatimonadota bacterium]
MQSIHQEIQVRFRYAVHFTTDLFGPGNPLLRDVVRNGSGDLPAKVLFAVDGGLVRPHPALPGSIERYCEEHRAALQLARPPLVIEGGEGAKNSLQAVAALRQAIHDAGLCRHSYVVAVGGGAMLDVAGYAAATSHRGMRLIRVPTTSLAQADAAVGVKNSLNAFGKKNFLGTFAPPFAVLNDFLFLTTLSDRDWRGGVAEAIKVALIRDAAFFEFLEQHVARIASRDMAVMQQVIYRCAALHLRHIATSGDPFEFGASRPLDFGHWAAHKLEQRTNHALRHGEAVAIGIALDSTYSHLIGLLPAVDWQRALDALSAAGFSLYAPELSQFLDQRDDPRCLLQGLNEFREHLGGPLTVMLLRRIGQGVEVNEIDEEVVRKSIGVLERRETAPETGGPREWKGERPWIPARARAL